MLEAIQTEDEQMQGMLGPLLQHGLDVLFEFQLVEQPGHVIDFVFLAQIGDEPGEQARLAVPIALQIAPAADPDPLALTVFCPVLNAMEVGPPVSDDLIGLHESGLVVRVYLASPDGGGIFHDGLREAELLHHRRRVTEYSGLHVGNKDIRIGAFHQRIVQAQRIVLESFRGDIPTPLFLLKSPFRFADMGAFLLLIHAFVGF